jgi:hypothetical protein
MLQEVLCQPGIFCRQLAILCELISIRSTDRAGLTPR